MDRLQIMMNLQSTLDKRVGLREMDFKQASLQQIRALRHELCEVENEIGWKHWKEHGGEGDDVREEIVDCMHFLLSLCLVWFDNADDLYREYERKHKKNNERPDFTANE